MWLVIIAILASVKSFSISNQLTQTGESITPEMLQKTKDICDIAYSLYRYDYVSNAKYISSAMAIQGLQRNWDVMITYEDVYGYSGHSTNETWWISLKSNAIANNQLAYYISKNVPNRGVYINLTGIGNYHGTGINDSSLATITNIIGACSDQGFKTYGQKANFIQKRVQLFFGGKWGVYVINGSFGAYISVIDDAWVKNSLYMSALVYKMSN